MKILVLGAGAFGTALGGILTENGHEVVYFDPMLGVPLEECLKGAELMVLVAPSFALPELVPKLPREIPLVIATKGVLDLSLFDDFEDVMVLSGPAFADDLKAHKPARLTASDKRIRELFGTDYLDFDESADVRGILLCGALKNVYALYAGLLQLERNTPKYEKKLAEFAEEMRALLSANGGKPETVSCECGMGDLRLTCGMPSRNYEFGVILANDSKAKPEKTVEGLSALRKIIDGALEIPEEAVNLKELIRRSKEWA